MNRKLTSLGIAVLLSCFSAHAETLPVNAEKLAALRTLKIDDATITTVERDPSATKTIVKLVLNPAKGSNIHVEVWLPDAEKWNARFLGLGNGGAAGKINPGGLASMSAAGYAVAMTDMGTAPNSDSGIGNEEVWKDFGYRATHLMTVVGKQIVKAHYGRAPELSYFSGGSTGGQQALQEAQRYPEDYDGIAAAVAAHCRTPLHAYFLWNDQILKKCPFTKGQDASVIAAANEYMASREIPIAAGKFVSDPRCTAQDVEAVILLARKKDATLTDAHAAALRKLFDGPRHAVTGERIFNGIPLGSSIEASHGHLYL
ncbi:MAG: tannase/feruloyl esterase family alpha/beta hydrolase, partial [Prosthecobacter sp.]